MKIIYDSSCALCTRFIHTVCKFDRNNILIALPVDEYLLTENDIQKKAVQDEIHIKTDSGIIQSGSQAIHEIFKILPAARPYKWMLSKRTTARLFYATAKRAKRICLWCTKR
jgi:predicted DCC family thiol-disulfide oxidoreductase YuxK